jgi:hypothetical protein
MTSASRGRHLPTWALVSSLLGAGCIPSGLATASRDEHAASMSRARRPGEGDVYTAHAAYFARTETGERRRQQRLRTLPTTATAGQLCLRRIGNELHYLVADAFTTERRTVTWDAVVAAGLLAAFLLGTGAWFVWKGAAGRAVRDLPEEEPEQGKGADEAAGEAVAMTVPMSWAARKDDRLRKA